MLKTLKKNAWKAIELTEFDIYILNAAGLRQSLQFSLFLLLLSGQQKQLTICLLKCLFQKLQAELVAMNKQTNVLQLCHVTKGASCDFL